MSRRSILADAESARATCEAAADVIMTAIEQVLSQASEISEREPVAAGLIRAAGLTVLEACAFQDTVGQVLTRISAGPSKDPLMAGPNAATVLSPSDVDALMGQETFVRVLTT